MADRSKRSNGPFDWQELADTTIVLANPKNAASLGDITYEGFDFKMDKELFDMIYGYRQKGPWNKPNRRTVWVLVRRGDEEEQQDPLSWLATYLRPTAYKDSTGNVRDETTYGIGPAITLKANSGRGYATRMIQLVHYCLAHPAQLPAFPSSWGAPPPLFVDPKTRPQWLPYAIGAVLTTGVGIKIYGGATIGDVPHTGFRFDRDTVNNAFTFPLQSERFDVDSDTAVDSNWRSAWIHRREHDELGQTIAEEIRDRLATEPDLQGQLALAPLPMMPGDLGHVFAFANLVGAYAEVEDDTIVGARFYPAEAARAEVPAHQPDWPICLFRVGQGNKPSIMVSHLSRFPVDLVPTLVEKWYEAGKATRCVSVTGWAVDEKHEEIKALMKSGMTITNRYDEYNKGATPYGSVWYGPSDGSKLPATEWRWRMLERWSWG